MKTLSRKLIKAGMVSWSLFSRAAKPGVCFLIYHKVSGRFHSEIDMPHSMFRRQMEFLASSGRVVSYDRALEILRNNDGDGGDYFALTFDDGHEDFYTHAFPLMKDLGLESTLFVTTGFVDEGVNYPLSRISSPDVRPVRWEHLGEMIESGLVTIGAHTHTHPNLSGQPERVLLEELARPAALFRERFGLELKHFAYPRAIWDEKAESLVKRHYSSAVIAGGYKATSEGFDPYRIPRVPIRRSDGWLFFLAKIRGLLEAEEGFYSEIRKLA